MKARKLFNKAQSTLEYIAVVIAIIGVFMAIQKYYQRSLQGTFRQAGDAIGGGEQSD